MADETDGGGLIAGALEGPRLIAERPMVVLVWILAGVPAAILAGAAVLLLQQSRTLWWGPLFLLLIPIASVMRFVQQTAVYRAVLRPDASKAAYLRLGREEWRVATLGMHIGVGEQPLQVYIVPILIMLAAAVATAVAAVHFPAAMMVTIPVGVLTVFVAATYIAVRSSLGSVAAFVDAPNPRGLAFDRTLGRALPLLVSYGLAFLFWLIPAAMISAALWWLLAPAVSAFRGGWPADSLTWVRLVLAAVLLSTLGTLHAVFTEAPQAHAWRLLRGLDPREKTRNLFA